MIQQIQILPSPFCPCNIPLRTKKQDVDVVAWGQDAYFHTANTYGDIINGTDTTRFYYHLLDCTTPGITTNHMLFMGMQLLIQNCQLTINAGTNIYLHKNSGVIVGNPFSATAGGTIKVNGELGNEVTFRGDRLDSWYDSLPGQWDRVWLYPGSINNEFNYAISKMELLQYMPTQYQTIIQQL